MSPLNSYKVLHFALLLTRKIYFIHTIIFHCIFSSPANAQLLSLTSSPQLNGPICPGPIEFTCVGTRVPFTFQWRLNDTVRGRYSFEGNTTPVSITLDPLLPGVMSQVTSVSQNQDNVSMNISSTLSGGTSALDGSSVQCTVITADSEIYMVNVIGMIYITYDLCMNVGRELIERYVSYLSMLSPYILTKGSFL